MIWYWSEILLSTSLGFFFFFSPNISFGNVKFMFEIRWKNSGKKTQSACWPNEINELIYFIFIFFKPKSGTGRNLPKSSSIFVYGYCLLFFFLVSFDISNAQTPTTDPSEGTTLSLSLSLSLCVHFVIYSSFHFISIYWHEPLKSVYMNCNKPNPYRVGSIWNCSKASTSHGA